MKRQMKIAAVVSATALLAIGASFTSMAAAKTGQWVGNQCYDKNGDVYEYEFCYGTTTSKEYFVGEDGELVTDSWVEYDGHMYYVDIDGSKLINEWKLTTPYEDEEAEEAWYYFGATGKRTEDKKVVYQGDTYYLDGYGKMLTGWVDKVNFEEAENDDDIANLVYCDDNGVRVESDWREVYAPGVDVEEDDLDLHTEHYYYFQSLGAPVTGKQKSVANVPYIFAKNGMMLEGWVAKVGDDFVEIDTEDVHPFLKDVVSGEVYYTCEVDGHVKKNQWIYDYANTNWEKDPDGGKGWYLLQKDGKVLIPSAADATATYKVATDANAITFTEGEYTEYKASVGAMLKLVDEKWYLFDANGKMQTGLKEIDGDVYYFSANGDMQTGAQEIKDSYGDYYKFYFGTADKDGYKKGVGVTGNANGKLYKEGVLVKADDDYKYSLEQLTIVDEDGIEGTYWFVVNRNGSIQTSKDDYKDDGEVIIEVNEGTDPVDNKVKVAYETKAGVTKGSLRVGSFN